MSNRLMTLPVLRASLIVVLCATIAAPTLQAQKKKNDKKGKGPVAQTVWPLPPEQPRIRYIRSYQGPDDFKGGKKPSRFAALVLGPQDEGGASDKLVKPYGVAASSTGVVYVADSASRRVYVFDPNAKRVTFIGDEGNGKLSKPIGITIGADDTIYVADATLKRVFGYGADGRMLTAMGHEGELENPSGLAIDAPRGLLYVADASKHHVVCYDTTTGTIVRTIGGRGEGEGQFNFPTNLTVDRHGRLYVADTLNFRVQIFDADGRFVRTFGEIGDTFGALNRPKGIGVDSDGHIYVVDASFNNFQIFDDEGRLLLFVGSGGKTTGEFFLPAGMFIDAQDRIYVADQGNSRIQVFQYLNGATR